MKAIAVFHAHGAGLGVRIFCTHRPAFRHVFVAVNDGSDWIVVDARAHFTVVERLFVGPDYDLATFYRAEGFRVIETTAAEPAKRALAPIWFSCVETAKRVLGLRSWWIWTPYQLYRHLRRRHHGR